MRRMTAARVLAAMKSRLPGTHGIRHQRSDGRVITACHRDEDPVAAARHDAVRGLVCIGGAA